MTRLILVLIERVTPSADREWVIGDTVEEFDRIEQSEGRTAARRWLRGELCRVLVAIARHRLVARSALLRRPTALVPLTMSVAALVTVIGYTATFGTARQADEGTAAHVWQLLMAGQIPIIAFFAIKWLPIEPRQAALVLALQGGAVTAAMFPVWWFQW